MCKASIELENDTQCYRPGEIIKGLVILDIGITTLLKALSLQFNGFACTKWEKSEIRHVRNSAKTKSKVLAEYRKDYVSTTNYLIGSEMANTRPVTPDIYYYNFMINIPQNIPPTFDSSMGFIRYELTVHAHYGDHRNSLYNSPIIIEQIKDLRLLDSAARLPVETEQLEQKSYIKFWQQPLQLYIGVPQRAYVAGECIIVHVKLTNPEKIKLDAITSKLNRIVTYKGFVKEGALQKTTEKTIIASSNHQLHGQNFNSIQHLQLIFIPKTPASMTFNECKCIALSYEVEVFVKCQNKKRSIKAAIPILIGSISLSSDVKILPLHLNNNNVASITVARSMEELTLPSVLDLQDYLNPIMDLRNSSTSMSSLASCFKEADFMATVHLNKKSKHQIVGDLCDFKPKYLYYDLLEELNRNAQDAATGRQ